MLSPFSRRKKISFSFLVKIVKRAFLRFSFSVLYFLLSSFLTKMVSGDSSYFKRIMFSLKVSSVGSSVESLLKGLRENSSSVFWLFL
ncbi:MAG: hypothetical protein PWQ16_810 [bacterium]|nr:hypothetical protein [bacterium]